MPRLTPDDVAELKQLLREDHTHREIAEAFGVSTNTIQYHANQAGLGGRAGLRDDPGNRRGSAPEPATAAATPDWFPHLPNAACHGRGVNPDLFFPDVGRKDVAKVAINVCTDCDARAACLDWALRWDERGIWGGLTEQERRKLKKESAA